MQDRDSLFRILLHVDHDSIVSLYGEPLNRAMMDVFSISHFWKKRAETMHSVHKPFRDDREVNWRTIYKVTQHLEMQALELGELPNIYCYCPTDVRTMKAIVAFVGPPTDIHIQSICDHGLSTEMLEYYIGVCPNVIKRSAQGALYNCTRTGSVDLCRVLITHPLTRDSVDIAGAFSSALDYKMASLVSLYAPLLTKREFQKHALTIIKKHSLLLVVSMFKNVEHSPTSANLKSAINAGRIETVQFLLSRVSPASKTNTHLLAAAETGEMMFRVVLYDKRVDPSIRPAAVLAALLKNTLNQDTARWLLLEDPRFDPSSVSTEELSLFMIFTAGWIEGRTVKLLEVISPCREQLLSIARSATVVDALLNFLLQNKASPTEVLAWMRVRLTHPVVRDAIISVAKNVMPERSEAEPIRALLFGVVYPGMSVSENLSYLRREGTCETNLLLSRTLLSVYKN